MARQVIGSVQPYVLGDDIECYLERVELYLEVNKVDETRKTGYLLTIGGAELFDVARKVCSPEDPKKMKADLVAGVADQELRRKLLADRALDYETAFNIALSWDAAKQQNEEMRTNEEQTAEIAT
uniref:Uncharacterized protein n=1 Tax=Anopheles quadriannulatus TaxID=34691 RepID=A0A182WRB5_ANOQN